MRAQGATEGINAYVTELRKLARNCEFGELHDSIIRDRIVCSIRSNEVRKRLLREKDLNLEGAVEMCKSSEITENQAKNMVVDQDDRVVRDVKDDSKKSPGKSRPGNGKHSQTKKPFNCRRCGKVHQPPMKCPAYGQVCHKCKQRNHYSKMCQSKPRYSSKQVKESKIIEHPATPVIGLQTCHDLNLVKRVSSVDTQREENLSSDNNQDVNEILKKYEDVFDGIGCLEGTYQIKIDPNVSPVVHPPRKIPFTQREKVKEELDRMEKLSVIYATSGFWHIKLDEKSSELLTFNTPFGQYRYLRMPFGINSAPEIFQKRMTQAFEDLSGVKTIADDILIWGRNEVEHNHRLEQVLERSRKVGSKKKILTAEVPYIGHVLTANGLKPDPSKVCAVEEMPSPADKPALLRFLGMVNYIGKFIPNLADLTQPLRELLHKEVEWHWSERQEKAFRAIKEKLTSDATLQYYDVDQCATHPDHSTLLKKNYAQIEKELLAIVYGCTKCHQYVYGKKVKVQTDHKPLEALFKKPLFQTLQRLQRMMLSLQHYDLQVEYEPGKNLFIADTLSRAPEESNETAANTKDEFEVLTLENMPISEVKLKQFKEATRKDVSLLKLKTTVKSGWPERKSQVDPELREYWNIKEEISVCADLLMRSDKLIVPISLRDEMLRVIHSSHLGIENELCKKLRTL
ncbi:hypothetical protein ACROYT_G001509 [Oculina patagonica]